MTRYKKSFPIFVTAILALCLAAVVGFFGVRAFRAQQEETILSQEEIAAANLRRELFAAWYADYQQDLDHLSRNWQLYRNIMDAFKNDDISRETCHMRLKQLAEDERMLIERIEGRQIPAAVDDFLYEEMTSVARKTRAYANAQYRTIALSRAAADIENVRSDSHEEQSRDMEEIMLREAPAQLFVAKEIASIKEYLAPADKQ